VRFADVLVTRQLKQIRLFLDRDDISTSGRVRDRFRAFKSNNIALHSYACRPPAISHSCVPNGQQFAAFDNDTLVPVENTSLLIHGND
jgi:hypothetical protein